MRKVFALMIPICCFGCSGNPSSPPTSRPISLPTSKPASPIQTRVSTPPPAVTSPAIAEAKPQPRPAPEFPKQPIYLLTKLDGSRFLIDSYVIKNKFHTITELITHKASQHISSNVKSIERVAPDNYPALREEAIAKAYDLTGTGRTAKVKAKPPSPQPPALVEASDEEDPPLASSDGPAGYSSSSRSSGASTHVGPKGGVYHYSASGKKVYRKKK